MTPVAAHATTVVETQVVWGHSYAAKSRTYHQVRGQRGPLVINSHNGGYNFVVNTNGDLSVSKLYGSASYVCSTSCYVPYWRAHSDGKGSYFSMQSNGELVERSSDNKSVVWRSHQAPGTGYNYTLALLNSGNLIEWSSKGDPLKSAGRHTVWQINRAPGAIGKCGGGELNQGRGITDFTANLADEGGPSQYKQFSVDVHNVNVLPLLVSVYRRIGNTDYHKVTKTVYPTKTVSFSAIWANGQLGPHSILMRTDAPSDSVLAAAIIYGHCWYRA